MTAFQRTLILFVCTTGLIFAFRWYQKLDMTMVYPDNCAFIIDQLFAQSMRQQITDFIDAAYKKNKNPSHLLPDLESAFPAIKSVIVDMHNPENFNFTIQAYQPIFVVNDERVVCQYGKLFNKETFAPEIVASLQNIAFDGVPVPKNIGRLTEFFENLQDPILQDFSIRWMDKHIIWLDQKKNHETSQDLSLLVGYDTVPSWQDIEQCRNLRGQISDAPCKDKKGKPCKRDNRWACDLRFDQQVILFSTK